VRLAKAAAALVLLAAVGCGGPMILRFEGGERLNPNMAKNPPENIPVTVLIFKLKENGPFANATAEQLWTPEKAKAVLGQDQVGEARPQTINASDKGVKVDLGQLPADVRYIGIVAKLPKQDPPKTRHLVLPKDEADDGVFLVVDYELKVVK
jgi:type VI secretion system VasD/TssJ family lipoprotein